MPDGTEINMGIHMWHVLLNMTEAHIPPPEPNYGLAPHQRDNVRATLESMSMLERCQMVSSFLRMMSLLITEVADVVDVVLADEAEERAEGEGSGLMQRFLVRKEGDKAKDDESKKEDGVTTGELVEELRGDPFELELRALTSALELSPMLIARRRAEAIMERTHLVYGVGVIRSEKVPLNVVLLESALASYLSTTDARSSSSVYEHLNHQDKDFVDYWWHLIMRFLCHSEIVQGLPQTRQSMARPTPAETHVDKEDYEMAEEEKKLMKEMEEEDRREAGRMAAEEYAVLQDSQEKEDSQLHVKALEAQAAKF